MDDRLDILNVFKIACEDWMDVIFGEFELWKSWIMPLRVDSSEEFLNPTK